jgi:hypothetical protein
MEKAKAQKAQRKAAAEVTQPLAASPKSSPTRKKPLARSTPAKEPAAKAKRKLNLSPERRAQLSAAMKARWAAKRAEKETGPQNGSSDQV